MAKMFDSLPVIIVTAKTKTAAAEFISEVIDDDVTAELKAEEHESADRVWRLRNKYYCADVRVHPRGEREPALSPPPPGPAGAHVVLLSADEMAAGAASAAGVVSRRLASAGAAADAAGVRLVACDAEGLPEELADECAASRLEAVALRERASLPGEREEPFARARGVPGVRAALHAHAWPGLVRHAPARASRASPMSEGGFLRALGALGEAASLTASLRGAERRAAAELVVAEFAAAIGHSLDDLDSDDAS